jgi:hypothetical protein
MIVSRGCCLEGGIGVAWIAAPDSEEDDRDKQDPHREVTGSRFSQGVAVVLLGLRAINTFHSPLVTNAKPKQ